MAQHDYSIANSDGASVRADINGAFAAAVSQNAGPTAPTTTYAHMPWPDTTSGLFKMRNAANSAWVTVGTLGAAYLGLVPANGMIYPPSDGTAGQIIGTNGSGTLGFVTPGEKLLSVQTASNSATIDFTGLLTGTYAGYTVRGSLIIPASNNVTLVGQVSVAAYSRPAGATTSMPRDEMPAPAKRQTASSPTAAWRSAPAPNCSAPARTGSSFHAPGVRPSPGDQLEELRVGCQRLLRIRHGRPVRRIRHLSRR